jgi:hypothetical protein
VQKILTCHIARMAKKRARKRPADTTEDLLKKILIAQLSIARVGQREIASIVGISVGAVNAIARHVKLPKLPKE